MAHNAMYRFFICYKIVFLIPFSMIASYNFQSANHVLRSSNFDYFYIAALLTCVFILAFLLFDIFFNHIERARYQRYLTDSKLVSYNGNLDRSSIVFVFAVFLLNVALMGLPQMYLFSDLTSQEFAHLRVAKLHSAPDSPSILKNILGRDIAIFTYFWLMARLVLAEGRAKLPLRKYVILLGFICTYYISLELTKSGIVYFLIYSYLFYYSVRCLKDKEILSLKQFIKIGVLAGSIAFIMFFLVYPGKSFEELAVYALMRLGISQTSAYIFVVSEWMSGNINPDLDLLSDYIKSVFRISDFTAPGKTLTMQLFPEAFEAQRMNYLSTFFLADAIYLGGISAAVILSILVSFFFRFILFLSVVLRPTAAFQAFAAFFLFGSNINSSAFPFIFSASSVAVTIFVLIFTAQIRFTSNATRVGT